MGAHKNAAECIPSSGSIPRGLAKSGRKWKVTEQERSTAKTRKGVLQHMSTTFEQKMLLKEQKLRAKELEAEMKNEKKEKIEEKKRLAVERDQRRAANQFKSSSFQVVRIRKNMFFECSLFKYINDLYLAEIRNHETNEQKAAAAG